MVGGSPYPPLSSSIFPLSSHGVFPLSSPGVFPLSSPGVAPESGYKPNDHRKPAVEWKKQPWVLFTAKGKEPAPGPWKFEIVKVDLGMFRQIYGLSRRDERIRGSTYSLFFIPRARLICTGAKYWCRGRQKGKVGKPVF